MPEQSNGPAGPTGPAATGAGPDPARPTKILRRRFGRVYSAAGLAGPTRRYVLIVALLVALASLPTLVAIIADPVPGGDRNDGALDIPFLPPPSAGPVAPPASPGASNPARLPTAAADPADTAPADPSTSGPISSGPTSPGSSSAGSSSAGSASAGSAYAGSSSAGSSSASSSFAGSASAGPGGDAVTGDGATVRPHVGASAGSAVDSGHAEPGRTRPLPRRRASTGDGRPESVHDRPTDRPKPSAPAKPPTPGAPRPAPGKPSPVKPVPAEPTPDKPSIPQRPADPEPADSSDPNDGSEVPGSNPETGDDDSGDWSHSDGAGDDGAGTDDDGAEASDHDGGTDDECANDEQFTGDRSAWTGRTHHSRRSHVAERSHNNRSPGAVDRRRNNRWAYQRHLGRKRAEERPNDGARFAGWSYRGSHRAGSRHRVEQRRPRLHLGSVPHHRNRSRNRPT